MNLSFISTQDDSELCCNILFCDVLQDHVDVDIKAPERTHKLLFSLHNNPKLASDALV